MLQHGIYKGDLIRITEVSNVIVHYICGGDPGCAPKNEVTLIDNEYFQQVEPEVTAAKNEIESIRARMYRMDEEYRKKSEALREMYMAARQKEISVINRILKDSRKKDGED